MVGTTFSTSIHWSRSSSRKSERLTRHDFYCPRVESDCAAVCTLEPKARWGAFKTSVDTLKTSVSSWPWSATSGDEDRPTVADCGVMPLLAATTSLSPILPKRSRLPRRPTAVVLHRAGTGKITITYGDKSFDVDIDSTKRTRSPMFATPSTRRASSPACRPRCSTSKAARAWCLRPLKTGADTPIQVAVTGGDGGLADLAYSGTNTATYMTQMQAAHRRVHRRSALFDHYSDTNTVAEAIDGVADQSEGQVDRARLAQRDGRHRRPEAARDEFPWNSYTPVRQHVEAAQLRPEFQDGRTAAPATLLCAASRARSASTCRIRPRPGSQAITRRSPRSASRARPTAR